MPLTNNMLTDDEVAELGRKIWNEGSPYAYRLGDVYARTWAAQIDMMIMSDLKSKEKIEMSDNYSAETIAKRIVDNSKLPRFQREYVKQVLVKKIAQTLGAWMEENDDLRKENDYLRDQKFDADDSASHYRNIYLMEKTKNTELVEKINHMEEEDAKARKVVEDISNQVHSLIESKRQLKEEIVILKKANEVLRDMNSELREKDSCGSKQNDELKAEISALNKKNVTLQYQVNSLLNKAGVLSRDNVEIREQKFNLCDAIMNLEARLQEAKETQNCLQNVINGLNEENDELYERATESENTIRRVQSIGYINHNLNYLF